MAQYNIQAYNPNYHWKITTELYTCAASPSVQPVPASYQESVVLQGKLVLTMHACSLLDCIQQVQAINDRIIRVIFWPIMLSSNS